MTLVEDVFLAYDTELSHEESGGEGSVVHSPPAAPSPTVVATLVAQRKQMHGLEEGAVRHVCDRSPLPMWAYAESTKQIVYVNETAAASYGYTTDEMRTMSVFDLLSPEENLRLSLHFETYPTVEGIAGYWRYQTRVGEQRWFELFCQKIELAGSPAQLVTAIDVTAKVASFEMQTSMLEDLQESQRAAQGNAATLKMILEEMSDAFAAFDSDWHFAAMNRRAEVLLRNDRSFLIGKSIWQEYPNAVGTVFYDKCQEVLREGRQVNFEYYSENVGRWLEVSAFPLTADFSEALHVSPQEPVAIYGVSIFFRDVTARKEAEAEKDRLVRERNAEVVLQRHFLKEVLFSATEGKLHLCESRNDFPVPSQEPKRPPLQISTAGELASVRQQVREAVLACGFTLERGYDLTAAASEAAMNALQHSNAADRPAHASVCFAADGSEIQVWVTDYGKGMQLRDLPRATLLRGHSTRGTLGHGFHLILQLVDEIYLMTGAGGTTVVLRQFLQPPAFDWLAPDEIGK